MAPYLWEVVTVGWRESQSKAKGKPHPFHLFFFFSHSEDFEDDGEEEEDKDSDSEDVKKEVGTLALASNDLYIHNSTKENVPFYVQLSPG